MRYASHCKIIRDPSRIDMKAHDKRRLASTDYIGASSNNPGTFVGLWDTGAVNSWV